MPIIWRAPGECPRADLPSETIATMTDLPHARYIIVPHDGAWKINLNNSYYGPFPTQQAAIDSATETAKKAAAGGYPASVLLMNGTAFDTAWTSIENDDT